MGKNQHVVPHGEEWAVKGEGNRRATSVHETQKEAIEAARDIARNQRSELFIHGEDGRIRERDSHGHDPYPPKG
jgi:uncharacterized protein YdaT